MSNISLEQAGEFFRRFFRFGGTVATLKKLAGDDALMKCWVKSLEDFSELKLIHGMYNKPSDVLEEFMARCSDKGIDFSKFTWVGPEISPFEFTDDPSVVVILDATLGTLQETCNFACEWVAKDQKCGWRWPGLKFDPQHLRLLEGSEPYIPFTLRWRRIKLDMDMSKRPEDLRDPKRSPGLAGLFLAAQHPERIAKTDYQTRFGYWLPGLECTVPGKGAWQSVPCIDFSYASRQVGFHAFWRGHSRSGLAVPVFWEN